MISPHEESNTARGRRTALEEEQHFCIEALETGEFDKVSDKVWIDLCQKAATRGKSSPAPEDMQEE